MMRNLIYHVAPLIGSEHSWQWNLTQLRRRLTQFDGRRLIAIASGEACAPPEAVQEHFHGEELEFHIFANDPRLREVATFPFLLEQIRFFG